MFIFYSPGLFLSLVNWLSMTTHFYYNIQWIRGMGSINTHPTTYSRISTDAPQVQLRFHIAHDGIESAAVTTTYCNSTNQLHISTEGRIVAAYPFENESIDIKLESCRAT